MESRVKLPGHPKHTAMLIRVTVMTLALAGVAGGPAFAQGPQRLDQSSPPLPETASEPQGFIAEPGLIQRTVIFADRHFGNGEVTNGFYTDFANMVPGAGWLSGGVGWRQWYSRDRLFVDTAAAYSWHGYKAARARVELPKLANSRLALGAQVRWQDFTQIDFYGQGPATVESDVSEYRLKSREAVVYSAVRPVRWFAIGLEAGWLQPEVLPRAGTFKRDVPDTGVVFPGESVFAVLEQPAFFQTGASLTADTRDFPGHPLRGGLYRAALTNYADRDTGFFTFRRYEAEGAQFVPIAGGRVVLALRGWLVTSDAEAGRAVPLYLQPSLGGHNTLRSYADYRFHDRHMLGANLETRLALMTHVDAAVFVDAGNVAPRIGDLDLAKRSYGAGLRLHSRRQTFARLDVARGDEGWRVLFRLSDPLNLSRLSRRSATVPFVP